MLRTVAGARGLSGGQMECKNCGLLNPDTAMRCDCGYDFATHTMRTPYLVKPAMPASDTWVRQYAIACGVVLGIEVLLLMMRPPFDDEPFLHNLLGYPLRPGLFVASLLSLEGVDLSSVAVWLVFALGLNAMLYGALLLLCWRRWVRKL
jgi:hypothetical protein